MKLQTFLNEDTDIDFNTVLKECSEIIDIYNDVGKVLYRGSKSHSASSIIKVYPRNDRRPLDMPIYISNALDDEFYQMFDWKPRSEGVFCTSDYNVASSYSNNYDRMAYVFFPKNGFKFLWSTDFEDLFSDVFDCNNDDYKTFDDDNDDEDEEDYDYRGWEWDYEKIVSTYTDKNIGNAIRSRNEMAFKCDWYYLVNKDDATMLSFFENS